LNQC